LRNAMKTSLADVMGARMLNEARELVNSPYADPRYHHANVKKNGRWTHRAFTATYARAQRAGDPSELNALKAEVETLQTTARRPGSHHGCSAQPPHASLVFEPGTRSATDPGGNRGVGACRYQAGGCSEGCDRIRTVVPANDVSVPRLSRGGGKAVSAAAHSSNSGDPYDRPAGYSVSADLVNGRT